MIRKNEGQFLRGKTDSQTCGVTVSSNCPGKKNGHPRTKRQLNVSSGAIFLKMTFSGMTKWEI